MAKMVDFKVFVDHLKDIFGIESNSFYQELTLFLVDNDWFGITPVWDGKKLMVDPSSFDPILERIGNYFAYKDANPDEKSTILMRMLETRYPTTAKTLSEFYAAAECPCPVQYALNSFLLSVLNTDVIFLSNTDLEQIIKKAADDLLKKYGDYLTFFFAWVREHYKTTYTRDYQMTQRVDMSGYTEAYDIDDYLRLMFCLFNTEFIEYHDMYERAAAAKNYVDTWLFLALHFITAIRNTDLVRIYHPKLIMSPAETLEAIGNGTFSDADARYILSTITYRLNALPLRPNKTLRYNNVASIKFNVPESCEVHIGKLFACAEAHHQLAGLTDDDPLIRIITDYERINRYMGEEIGALFLSSNFRSRAANKANMQSIMMITDDVLSENGEVQELHTKGYMLAALARSHKGDYNTFAVTTATYLKDAKFSGLTKDFVERELWERKALSFIPLMLLSMITENKSSYLPEHDQTQLIKTLNLTPRDCEQAMTYMEKQKARTEKMLQEMFAGGNRRKEAILLVLHRLGSGVAVSKQDECLCLMTAMNRKCPYDSRSLCVGCDFEVGTKSTVFLMIEEFKRLRDLAVNTNDLREKGKYVTLIKKVVLPALDELLTCLKENYGPDAVEALNKMITEVT